MQSAKKPGWSKTAFLSVTLCFAALAEAEDLLLIQEVPHPSELGAILFPEPGESSKVRVRSIRFTQPAPAESGAPQQDAASGEAGAVDDGGGNGGGAAVGFNIQFAHDSPDLLPETLPYLDAVGQMLIQERTRDARLLIAGHADASGDAAYNKTLSEARAIAVQDYLARNYHIERNRLQTVGYGEQQPLPDTDPMDGLNRRVEFHPLD